MIKSVPLNVYFLYQFTKRVPPRYKYVYTLILALILRHKSESTHQGEHKCVVPELLTLLLTDDLYKYAGKGGHLNCAASGGLFLYSGRGQWI